MARLNVEESFFKDPRLKILEKKLGSRFLAIGACIEFWRLAQEYWGNEKRLVPRTAFEAYELPEGLFDAGFAETRGNMIYACGSEEKFSWLEKARESGRRGGLASGTSRNPKKDLDALHTKAAPRINKINKITEPYIEATLKPASSETNPLYSLLSSPSSSLSSLKELIPKGEKQEKPPSAIEPYRANPVGIWVSAYKEKYGVRYEIQAKDGKILTTFAKSRTEDQIRTLFACYLAINEKLYSESKHPLSLFFRDLQKISVAAFTGVNPALPAPFDISKLRD